MFSRVVIIEDEELLRRGLVTTTEWKKLGCIVIGEADNAEKGEEIIRRLKPDIVITDIKLQDRTGLDIIHAVKDELTATEYIIISGYADFTYAQKAIELGATGYILKPIDDTQLEYTIRKAASSAREKKERCKQARTIAVSEEYWRFLSVLEFSDYREKYLQQAIQIISAHYAEQLTVRDVAEFLKISESTLLKLFNKRTGYSFLGYLTLFRMKKAAEELQKKEVTVNEAAHLSGYRDYKYFCELFKKFFGVTPFQYKKGGIISLPQKKNSS